MPTPPSSGTLRASPLPELLLGLGRTGFSGHLQLERARTEKTIGFRAGVPVHATSNLASDSLTRLLIRQGSVPADAENQVQQTMRSRRCKEEAALLQLKLLAPKQMLHALRELVRRRILDCFAWPDAAYRLDASSPPGVESDAFRVELLALVRDGLASHWPADRLLTELSGSLGRFPRPQTRFEADIAVLRDGREDVGQLLDGLCPEAPVSNALPGGPTPAALATLWVLQRSESIVFADAALASEGSEEEAAPVESEPEAQIEIEILGGATAAPQKPAAETAKPKAGSKGREARAETMRKEVVAKHAGLGSMDHYEMLDVARDATAAQIKRAYLQAAKRFHPDALSRLGLDDLKAEANEAFARIAEAYEVLSDPDKRSNYDAEASGEGEIDVERLAQAEKLYRKGEIMLRGGNFNAAVDFFEGAVAVWPDDAVYQSNLGWTLYKMNPPDLDRAIEHLERALEIEADDDVRQKLDRVRKERGG